MFGLKVQPRVFVCNLTVDKSPFLEAYHSVLRTRVTNQHICSNTSGIGDCCAPYASVTQIIEKIPSSTNSATIKHNPCWFSFTPVQSF